MGFKRRLLYASLIIIACFTACKDQRTVADDNQSINNRTWSYVNKIRVPVVIKDNKVPYNVFINLRHTGDYKYSNIFLLIHMKTPAGKVGTERKEFKLAYPDGQWLGKGSGNLYSYQLPYKSNYVFPDTGNYWFEIEQNMRDSPLKEIADVGLRVEKSN
jgi:gliding motility-associated lipoprotein GldH